MFLLKKLIRCLEAAQLENRINYQEKKTTVNSLKDDNKELIKKSNKLILKTPQRFRSQTHNVFTEEINKML